MKRLSLALGWCAVLPGSALAGMPSVSLTDVARLRLENLSFFLVGFLFTAFLIQRLWNYLGKDFSFLPRLHYLRALGLVTLWGLLFVLVLTMISGARELMTPGAWVKNGATYKLADDKADPAARAQREAELDRLRRDRIDRLRTALWDYAQRHDWKFPTAQTDPAIPADLWETPDVSAMRYVYVGGVFTKEGKPLAFEPELFGTDRYVILTNGQVRRMTSKELERELPVEKKTPAGPKGVKS